MSLNFVAWITFVLMCIIQDTVGDLSFWMYIILQLLSGCTLTVILILARNRKNEMLKADTQPVFVDDDDYWKTGFYYNPNDPHSKIRQAVFDQLLAKLRQNRCEGVHWYNHSNSARNLNMDNCCTCAVPACHY